MKALDTNVLLRFLLHDDAAQTAKARSAIRARKSDEQFTEFMRQVRDKSYVEYKIDDK